MTRTSADFMTNVVETSTLGSWRRATREKPETFVTGSRRSLRMLQ
jgi:hypothetical protein